MNFHVATADLAIEELLHSQYRGITWLTQLFARVCRIWFQARHFQQRPPWDLFQHSHSFPHHYKCHLLLKLISLTTSYHSRIHSPWGPNLLMQHNTTFLTSYLFFVRLMRCHKPQVSKKGNNSSIYWNSIRKTRRLIKCKVVRGNSSGSHYLLFTVRRSEDGVPTPPIHFPAIKHSSAAWYIYHYHSGVTRNSWWLEDDILPYKTEWHML